MGENLQNSYKIVTLINDIKYYRKKNKDLGWALPVGIKREKREKFCSTGTSPFFKRSKLKYRKIIAPQEIGSDYL